MFETNLSDRWAREAARRAEEQPVRKPAQPDTRRQVRPVMAGSSPLAALRVTPEELAAAGARIGGQPVVVKKDGVDCGAANGRLRSQWMTVTPALAQQWLHNNFRNRPVKEDVVTAYARDMKRGRWKRTHQGIAFNDRDELIDGQHRLMAIGLAGVAVEMMVTFGLPSKNEGEEMTVMDCVDRGATRTVADQLVIQHGMKHGRLIAMISATLGSLCFGERARRLSVGQTLDIYREFQKGIDFVIEHRSKAAGLKMAGVLAGFALAHSAGWVEAAPLFVLLNRGEVDKHSALAKLHAFLTSEESALLMRSHDRGLVELVLQTLWLVKEKGDPAAFGVHPDGAAHFKGLQPERVARVARLFALKA